MTYLKEHDSGRSEMNLPECAFVRYGPVGIHMNQAGDPIAFGFENPPRATMFLS